MQLPITQADLAQRIAWGMSGTFSPLDDGGFLFESSRFGISISSPCGELQNHIDSLDSYSVFEETSLTSETTYEILVQEESPLHLRRLREGLCVTELDDGLEYEISAASDQYFVWLLSTIPGNREMRDIGFGFIAPGRIERAMAAEYTTPLEILKAISIHRFTTLKITSRSKTSPRRFQQLGASFLFHVAFNLDVALVPLRFLEELSSRGRISRMRRARPDEIDAPRRIYNEDLVAHYVLAVSTDSPSVQFLSYYHVLEHFFETIFNDELIERIRNQITHPAFSYRRRKDLTGLVDQIKKSLQIRSETITFSELEALRLTLTKYCDPIELRNRLNEYSPSLLDHYRASEVAFSKAPAVDLRNDDAEQIFKTLARRIYATRNALVHSKEGDKQRYVPFKDERVLMAEVPLMRFVAEQVIIATSNSP